MSDDFVSINSDALTLEAARYNLQTKRLLSFAKQLEKNEEAARKLTDRVESSTSDLRLALSELRALTGTSGEHVQVTLRAIESLLAAIAEKNLSKSISRSVVEDVYAELTPLLEEAIKESAASVKRDVSESTAHTVEQLTLLTRSIADAVAGKAPLPPTPDAAAPILNKIRQRAVRDLTRFQRFCITAAPPLVTLASLSVLVASLFYVAHFFVPALK